MRKQLYILSLLFIVNVLQAQDPVQEIWNQVDSAAIYNAQEYESEEPIGPFHYSTNLGTTFGFSPLFGSGMNVYLAPQLDFSATKRLTFHGGLMLSQTFSAFNISEDYGSQQSSYSMMSLYAAASYQLSENLYIHGAGVKSLLTIPGQMGNPALDFHDISFGATYVFGNFSIGASFHSTSGSNFYMPFGGAGNNMYGSPLSW